MSKPGRKVKVVKLPLNKIKLNKNSRMNIDPDELDGLMQSIKEEGLLQPIGVVDQGNGSYEVAYGNRRFLAVSRLGLNSIPAIIHEKQSETEVDIKNLTENVQRRNVSLAEIGRYVELMEKNGLTPNEVAVRLGVPKSYINACVNAFSQVPEEYRGSLESSFERHGKKQVTPGKISIRTANRIISAEKSGTIRREEVKKLFKAAKSDKKFQPENIQRYIAAAAAGKDIHTVKPIKTIRLTFTIDQDEFDKLYEKFVLDGPCRSVSEYLTSILAGERAGSVKTMRKIEQK